MTVMQKQAAARIMSTTGWLSRQSESFRTEVLKRSLLRHHREGKVLCEVGDKAECAYCEVAGLVLLPSSPWVRRPGHQSGILPQLCDPGDRASRGCSPPARRVSTTL